MKIKTRITMAAGLLILGLTLFGSGCSTQAPALIDKVTVMKEPPDQLPPTGPFFPFAGQPVPQTAVVGTPYHPGDKIFIILAASKTLKSDLTLSRFTFFNQQTKEEVDLPLPKGLAPFKPGQISDVAFNDYWTVPGDPGIYEIRIYVGKQIAISATFSVTTVSQPTGTSNQTDELDGSRWKLVSINGTQLQPGSYISLYFNKVTIWGSSGINRYGANYSVQSPDTLTFSNCTLTAMGGPDNLVLQEKAYLEHFNGPVSYRFAANNLEISIPADAKPMVFERLPDYTDNPADLVGTKWQLVSLNNETVTEGLSITLNFDSDTNASGMAGNIIYDLPYKASGDSISWGINSRSVGELPEEYQRQVGHYTNALMWAASYHLTADKLEIFTATGETLLYKPLFNDA